MSEENAPNNPPLLTEDDRKFLKALVVPDIPPLLEEGVLYDAEKRVLEAFRKGWEAGEREVVVHPSGKFSTDESAKERKPTAKDWSCEDTILRAHFLRSLFLGGYDKFASRVITISCARIEGKLDLDYCESSFPFRFFWCFFPEGISLRAATIPELKLVKCLIDQDRQGFSLSATQVQVTTNVSLNDKFIASGKVLLNGANIGGQLNCDCGYFEEGLDAHRLKTGRDVLLRKGFKSDGRVNLDGANIGGQLVCTGGHFSYLESDRSEKGLTAQNLKTGEDVLLNKDFYSNGEVDLLGANIGGFFVCNGGYFKSGLSAQRLKTGQNVSLGEGFKSDGKVDLLGANIGGGLNCEGGCFEEGLIAQNLKTRDDVSLGAGFRSDGTQGKGFESDGKVDLFGADIGGQFSCAGGHFKGGLIAGGLRYQTIDIGGDWEKVLTWLRKIKMRDADGLDYRYINFYGDGEEFSTRLREIKLQDDNLRKLKMREGEFQPYEQLMTVYRRMGHPDWARRIGFELEKKRHKQSPKGLWRAWCSALKWTIGYGYKPFRSLWWAIGLPLVGTILFSACTQNLSSKFTSCGCPPAFLANEWIPSEGRALEHWGQKGQVPQDYPEFQPFVYSVEATFPVLPLGQLDKWHPGNTFFGWVLRPMLTFFGSVLLAILALFGVGVLRPTWKSEGDGG